MCHYLTFNTDGTCYFQIYCASLIDRVVLKMTAPLFQILSDLHTEKTKLRLRQCINQEAQVVLLAGDVANGADYARQVTIAAKERPEVTFVAVMGNSDLYDQDYYAMQYEVSGWSLLADNVHFLENEALKLPQYDLEIFGGVGWTNLASLERSEESYIQTTYEDFSRISSAGRCMSVAEMKILNESFRQRCISWAKTSESKHKIVLTHFPQSRVLANTRFSPCVDTAYFTSDDDDLIHQLARCGVHCMVSGHTHCSFDVRVMGVRQISNQYGFDCEETGYKDELFSLLPC